MKRGGRNVPTSLVQQFRVNTYSGLTFDHANIATAIVIYSFNNFARICRLYTYVDLVSYTKMQTLRNV